MKQEVIGLVRENAAESTALSSSLYGLVMKLMLVSALLQVLHLDHKVTKEKHRKSSRKAKNE